MHNLLTGWGKIITGGLYAVYMPEDNNFRVDLLNLGLTCIHAFLPKDEPVSKAFNINNGFNGTIQAKLTEEGTEEAIHMVNHSNNSASYVFKNNENGINMLLDNINSWTDAFCEEMKATSGGHAARQKNNSRINIEKDKAYVQKNCKMTEIKNLPAHLVLVDNLEYNGTVKNHTDLKYPQTKSIKTMNWQQRQIQRERWWRQLLQLR